MKQNENPTFPHELIVEILLRLPVRSLLRFKCVCKSWLTLISDPQFAKSHFDLAASPTDQLLMHFYGNKFESMDIEASLHDDDSGVVSRVVSPPPLSRIRYPRYSIFILGSCRGFILLYDGRNDIVVWNPSTGVHEQISDSHYKFTLRFLNGFGYDPTTEDYLVVLLALREPEIDLTGLDCSTGSGFFSFKTNSWHPIEDVAFPYMAHEFYMEVMGGCLTVYWINSEITEIWMMKEYKVQSSWTKCFVLSANDIPHDIFSPFCLTKSGGLFGSTNHGGLVKLNDEGELLKHHHLYDQWSYLESVVYRESLLSLPTLFEEEAFEDDQQ